METISSKLDSMHENLQKDLAELNNQPKAQRKKTTDTTIAIHFCFGSILYWFLFSMENQTRKEKHFKNHCKSTKVLE